MSAVQLLEQLGADASKRSSASDIFANQFQIGDAITEKSKIWCVLMPEKDDEQESEDQKDKEEIIH